VHTGPCSQTLLTSTASALAAAHHQLVHSARQASPLRVSPSRTTSPAAALHPRKAIHRVTALALGSPPAAGAAGMAQGEGCRRPWQCLDPCSPRLVSMALIMLRYELKTQFVRCREHQGQEDD
jgi:hypothetical protein